MKVGRIRVFLMGLSAEKRSVPSAERVLEAYCELSALNPTTNTLLIGFVLVLKFIEQYRFFRRNLES